MGHNIPKELVLALRRRLTITAFIETGTYKAQTALWAAEHFEQVYTIEAHLPRYQKTYAAIEHRPNLSLIYGDSARALPELLAEIHNPCIFWLDAHFCQGTDDPPEIECPLMDELYAINTHAYAGRHVLLIDDARLFTHPPPYPHDPTRWPTIEAVQKELTRFPRHVIISNDVIIAVPMPAVEIVEGFTREKHSP